MSKTYFRVHQPIGKELRNAYFYKFSEKGTADNCYSNITREQSSFAFDFSKKR